MPTAYVIDSSGAFYGQPFFDSNWQGPIVYGGAVYYCMEHDTTSGGGQAFVGVYKSNQSYPGTITSFTAQDTTNAPRITRANVFYPKTGGNLIYISVYNTAGGGTGQLALYTFDMNTDTYATIATGGPIPQQGAHRLAHRANGDWVIAYDVFGGGARDVYWTAWTGSWSAGVLVSTERTAGHDAFTVQVGVNDSDDVIIYREVQTTATGRYSYNYSVLSAAGALTTPRTLMSNQRRDLNQGVSGGPYYITSNDTWMFPFSAFNSFTDDNINIAKSTPSANPSSDSIETVATADNTVDLPGVRVTMNAAETTAYCEWNIPDQHQLVYATEAVGGTTWSSAAILIDTDTDPLVPPPGVSPVLVQRPSISISSTNEILWSFGTFGPDEPAGHTVCDIQYFGQTPMGPPPPPSLACPVGGGTAEAGTPYSATLVVSGGTGPFTFTIISRMPLPPGLTLNPATGVISGTPTQVGVFSYTAQVTDANGLIATTGGPCQITVGVAVSCPGGSATVGVPFTGTVGVSGTGPFIFSITAGALPDGLSLSPTTGVISGTPTGLGIDPAKYLRTWILNDPVARRIYYGLPTKSGGTAAFTVKATGPNGVSGSANCTIPVAGSEGAANLIYVLDYRELDTAEQIFAGNPVKIGYGGKMIATDHSRKWTRWNVPANSAAILRTDVDDSRVTFLCGNGATPGASGFGNLYTLDPTLLTDDDYGQIYPYYVTYGFVNHQEESGLKLGSHRKQHVYSMMFAAGVGNVILLPLCDSLSNPWPLIISRVLSTDPKFDIEGPGSAQAQRMFFKIYITPVSGTDNSINMSKLVIVMRPSQRMPVRGAAR